MERRRLLAVAAGAGASVLGGCLGDGSSSGWGDWFEGVDNYDGEVDETGSDSVAVAVGAGSDGLAFAPAAVTVSTGTTVTWRWTGRGGRHNVVHTGGSFESEFYSQQGATFEHTFDGTGYYKYFCRPHKELGMRGGVHVVES